MHLHKSTMQRLHFLPCIYLVTPLLLEELSHTMDTESGQSGLLELLRRLEPLLSRSENDNRIIVVMICGIAGKPCLDPVVERTAHVVISCSIHGIVNVPT